MPDVYSRAKRSEVMGRVKTRGTAPEAAVAKILRAARVRFESNVETLPGTPDFVVRRHKTVIFVHGCFWHGHENCGRGKRPETNKAFWDSKLSANKRRDIRVARALRKLGWRVITVWQCRLRKPDRVRTRILRILKTDQRGHRRNPRMSTNPK